MNGARLRSPARPRAPRSLTALAASGALLGLLLGLCVFAPARWLAWAAAHSGALALESPRGTLWNGSAQLWLVGGAGSPDRAALPERVRWQLQPDWGGLRLSLSADCCLPQPLQMRLGWSAGAPSLTVSDSVSDWPAQTLVGLGTPWNTLQPAGRMVLQTRGLGLRWSQQRLHVTGSASLQLQDLSSALSTLQPMGSYQLNLSAGPGAQLTLSTLRGDLLLSGNGSWTEQGLRFRGEARAAPGREDALANLLNIVGKREGARTLISLG
jgi:general secretion pathway protein N